MTETGKIRSSIGENTGLERAVDLGVSAELSMRQGGPAKPEA